MGPEMTFPTPNSTLGELRAFLARVTEMPDDAVVRVKAGARSFKRQDSKLQQVTAIEPTEWHDR
jgi:hypothetical protein